ncbi:MAG: TPM domain-containing protein [Aquabacterium sp.]|uniref:TPM domain-containing protein n=1 Tax=Aquabacterium sp. TaxID=1872578 RepID=UPI0025C50495|nr:TPM domain-containing protein [Aquabacterium sp.]MBI5925280.1 TPM domain-containing protein [Aquabacterium sp.]
MNILTRWARHLWLDAADARRLLGTDGLQRLEQAVRGSEARHMGELRLCIEAGLHAPALWRGASSRERAVALFSQLRVWDTEHNNGVLIYLLLAERRIEILADRGLHACTGPAVWQGISDQLSAALQAGRYEDGLSEAIQAVSNLLRQHFPLTSAPNRNELPDAVVLI